MRFLLKKEMKQEERRERIEIQRMRNISIRKMRVIYRALSKDGDVDQIFPFRKKK